MGVVNFRESSETVLTRTKKLEARRERVGNRRNGVPQTYSCRFQALVSINLGEKSPSKCWGDDWRGVGLYKEVE